MNPNDDSGDREFSDEELLAMMQRCSNWGRWGDDDELGTLNLITPSKRIEAASLVRSGAVVAMGRALSRQRTAENYIPIDFKMTASPHNRYVSTHDWFGVEIHGYAVTHLDSVSHCAFDGLVYNGRRYDDVWTHDGMTWGAITAMEQGVVTRGVLLDVARARQLDWLEPGSYITPADLEQSERDAGIVVTAGDALFVNSGLRQLEESRGEPVPIELRAGLRADAVEWLHQRGVALYGGDCVERIPGPSARVPMPLHMIGLVYMGLALLDWPDTQELAIACEQQQRWEFMFSCAPLRIPGGTGSAVNPLAIF